MHVVIFEGNQWRTFAPFSLTRPVFMLPCGVGTLLDKQLRAFSPSRVTLWVRPEMVDFCKRFVLPNLPCPGDINVPLDDELTMICSGRSLHFSEYEVTDSESVLVDEGAGGPFIRQAKVRSPGLSPADVLNRSDRWLRLQDLPRSMPQSRLPQYVWDLISWNEEAIVADFIALREPSQPIPAGPHHVVEPQNLWLGADVKLGPGCVLDGSRGPIILAEQVSVGANAVLQGPCYIGPHSQITALAYIRGGTSVGPMCKVGGEVSNSIILGYTNKPHDGFLGDSYIGEWVNLGAGTTVSNLKNTYSEIAMTVDNRQVKTGRRFLGSLIGDHTKIAIGTRLMTGSYIGYCCMIAASKFPPRFVPSFAYLTDDGMQMYRRDRAIDTMKSAFNRRNRAWTAGDEEMVRIAGEGARMVEGKSLS
jgi:UDP-N-acetylglucosamine diphosphorylase / glucose-1-phosphate thymidylyltransferase / UDP-N-acetylgalactosamine diphosphorylase / glucosamine-1-phosphate N-acetyltransferase / galactosamine-1-phosphate N-acetyltransferase